FNYCAFFSKLLAVLCGNSQSATVRPYKFGFTIEEQQHRAEQRDEQGIVMGEFGFITADGRYHVTVYATDENGKFRIISMKSFPYVAPPGKFPFLSAVATTTRAPPPKQSFAGAACSGCFLTNNAPAAAATSSPAQPAQHPAQHHKTEIRPLSLPLAPETITDPSKLPLVYQKQAFKLAQLAVSQITEKMNALLQGQAQGGQTQSAVPATPASQASLPSVSLTKAPVLAVGLPQGPPKGQTPVSQATQAQSSASQTPKTPVGQAQVTSTVKPQVTLTVKPQVTSTASKPQAIPTSTVQSQVLPSVTSTYLAPKIPTKQATVTPPLVTAAGQAQVSPAGQTSSLPLGLLAPAPARGPVRITSTGEVQGQLPDKPLGVSQHSVLKLVTLLITFLHTGTAFGAVGNAAASNNGLAQPATNAQNSPANGQSPANSPSLAATATKTGTGSTGSSVKQPALAVTTTQSGSGSSPFGKQPALTSTQTGSSQTGEAGDLYKFKYLLDYNGHEETGSRIGDKEGNYFAIGEDSVLRTIEYIANEFGYQPHISWRRLDASEIANLPTENSLKHYEFKWFNKAS
ncbi:hypothetical protein KR215_006974, partial [Drosophila sulfurigaster]